MDFDRCKLDRRVFQKVCNKNMLNPPADSFGHLLAVKLDNPLAGIAWRRPCKKEVAYLRTFLRKAIENYRIKNAGLVPPTEAKKCYCPVCDLENPMEAGYCTGCGRELSEEEEAHAH